MARVGSRRATQSEKEVGVNRRHFFMSGLLAGASGLASRSMQAQTVVTDVIPSTCGPTPPFMAPLPVPRDYSPVSGLSPAIVPGRHQHFEEYAPARFYECRVREFGHRFHPNLDETRTWGYDSEHPGPTLRCRYGEPVMLRIHNDLPANHVGFGIPQISTHLHNAHTATESDGFPGDFYGPGVYRDHHYCATLAGHDPAEALGTLWYHDHRLDFTAQNVYRGLAGMSILTDDLDTGDETTGLHLPSGDFDVPLVFQDRAFDAASQPIFNTFNNDGFLGDKFCVNGAIQPFMKVARRKYRFRMLNASLSRFYEFALSSKAPMVQIASDGNLLTAPVPRANVRIAPAERVDVIVDFSNYAKDTSVFLVNRLGQTSGKKPDGTLATPVPFIRFDIDRDEPDASVIPDALRSMPLFSVSEAVRTRRWVFNRTNGAWNVNGKIFNVNTPAAVIKQGTAEIWTLRNESGGWAHPIHIHFEEFRILSRNGRTPPAWEQGRKDVVVVGPNEEVRIFMRFRDFLGRHVMHCHNLTHEDHAMMIRWDIEA